jgi:predicted transcriptional regulator
LLRECTLQRSTHPVLYLEARPLLQLGLSAEQIAEVLALSVAAVEAAIAQA